MDFYNINLPQKSIEIDHDKKIKLGHGVKVKFAVSLYEFTCGHVTCSKICRVNMYDTTDSPEHIDKEAQEISKFEKINGIYYCEYCAQFHSNT